MAGILREFVCLSNSFSKSAYKEFWPYPNPIAHLIELALQGN